MNDSNNKEMPKKGNGNGNGDTSLILKIATYIISTLVAVIFTMIGFWLMEGREFITRSEAHQLIELENRVVIKMIQESNENDIRLQKVLEQNTKAIQDLHIQMAVLNSTLNHISSLSNDPKNDGN